MTHSKAFQEALKRGDLDEGAKISDNFVQNTMRKRLELQEKAKIHNILLVIIDIPTFFSFLGKWIFETICIYEEIYY